MTVRTAKAAENWLSNSLLPEYGEHATILYHENIMSEHKRALKLLAALLKKTAARKRNKTLFTINVPRSMVEAFLSAFDSSTLPGSPLFEAGGRSLCRAVQQFRFSRQKKPGRPALSKRAVSDRVSGKLTLDQRHRKRLCRRQRWDAEIENWFSEIKKRGETVLTTQLSFPKI